MSHAANYEKYIHINIDTFKLKSHQDNELLLHIIRERQVIETNYANELFKLAEKYKPQV